MSSVIRPVILCGGSGTRLWPLSRRFEPKQFQRLVGEHTLFQDTVLRYSGASFEAPVVLANLNQERRVQLDLEGLEFNRGKPQLVIEPAMRSTAPAIAAAAMALLEQDDDPLMLVAPSDHRIGKPDALHEAIEAALPFVKDGGIALFGIEPTSPETGFGYIRAGSAKTGAVYPVEAFVEKPNIEKARELVADGRHTWNSGMFMFRARTILAELEAYAPAVLAAVAEAMKSAERSDGVVRLGAAFKQAPEISIDNAVMERSSRLGVIPIAPEWDDLGSFEALWRTGEQDDDDNVIIGEAFLSGVRRSYIRAEKRMVAVVGLSNVVVVETADAVLVASRALSQDVKVIAQRLATMGHAAADRHMVEMRAGGTSEVIDADSYGRVVRLGVAPGRTLDLAEEPSSGGRQIVVLSGNVSVRSRTGEQSLSTGQSVAWPTGEALTFESLGKDEAKVMVCIFGTDRAGDVQDTVRREAS